MSKVQIRLFAMGSSPQIRQNQLKISDQTTIAQLSSFLKKQIKIEQIFLYVNNQFAPSMNEVLSDIVQVYGKDNNIMIYYSTTPALG